MSAKNRNGASRPHDRYLTPYPLARAAFEMLYGLYGNELYDVKRFLEPGAGPGTFCQLALQYGAKLERVVGVEIDIPRHEVRNGYCVDKGDFLGWVPRDKSRFDLSVCNPPFTFAAEFIEHNINLLNDNRFMLYLARIGLTGSVKRREFWNRMPLKEIWLCRPRPSFMSHGQSDASEYAFYLFQKCEGLFEPRWRWLDWD